MFFRKKNKESKPKQKLLSFIEFESRGSKIVFTISSIAFGITLLLAMVSTMKSETNWILWAISLICGCIAAGIFIFKSKKD